MPHKFCLDDENGEHACKFATSRNKKQGIGKLQKYQNVHQLIFIDMSISPFRI